MRIGIDTDGVLTDMARCNYEYGKAYFHREPQNPNAYSAEEMFGFQLRNELVFGITNYFKYCRNWLPRENCVEVIQKLNHEKHELYEITARKFVTKKNPLGLYSRHLLLRWYKKHELSFQKIILCDEETAPEEKLAACQKFQIHIMIEDKPSVAKRLAENGVFVFLFDAPYNRDVHGNNIIRVHSWKEIDELLHHLELFNSL